MRFDTGWRFELTAAIDIADLARRLEKLEFAQGVRHQYPLGALTTYRVGGAAALFVSPANQEEVLRLAEVTVLVDVPVLLVGMGSNLLVSDSGFEGIVVQLGPAFESIRIEGHKVLLGAATSMPVVARRTAAEGLTGFEWAVGVPGSVGGAVRMNAGGHGSDMASVLKSASCVDMRTGLALVRTVDELNLGYRSSSVGVSEAVLGVELILEAGSAVESDRLLAEIVRWRRENQPGGQNAGSVFVNPPGDSAGRLIDLAGARGLRIGTAQVSEKHANFIQADIGGSAEDVCRVMNEVRERVGGAFGVDLVPETVLVGFTGGLD